MRSVPHIYVMNITSVYMNMDNLGGIAPIFKAP